MNLSTAPRPIRSVLVANRGEIACRIFRTCRRLGLRTVAVYSDADRDALHVRSADEAHRLGPAAAALSYLDVDAVIRAVRESGADAVHPGYGFLSENAAFVRRCEAEGIIFIGPSSDAVAAMGSKIEAKKIAHAAGVPTVPGYLGEDQSAERLAAEAERIGWPVLIKASAGGGGRGMRVVAQAADLGPALASARSEARVAFGDDAVLLERLVAAPRHLEVQVIGDSYGSVLHLHERDCSVQRNHQKVIEEAPAPNLPDAVRATLFEAALTLARHIGYSSAGTVEFVMEEGGIQPYFLEMNTRLQVEHPVTEMVTGIDLVEWQVLVAAGLPLPATQDQVAVRGHAIEVRVAAERPDHGFQPSVGSFALVAAPQGARLDTGVAGGSSVGLHYDSMLAKLIAHGPDRPAALARLRAGLDHLALLGPATNQAFLASCIEAPAFAEGRATTRFLAETFPSGWRPDDHGLARVRALAAAAWLTKGDGLPEAVWRRTDGFRVMEDCRPAKASVEITDEYGTASIVLSRRPGAVSAEVGDLHVEFTLAEASGDLFVDGRPAFVRVDGSRVAAATGAMSIEASLSLQVEARRADEHEGAASDTIKAPLPGMISDIPVRVGDRVAKGDPALLMEAMKLVHTVAFGRDGMVSAIHCAVGDTVVSGAILMNIEAEGG